jgi:hypothetical protein
MFLIYVIKPSFAPKECHTRAWHVVRDFIQETMNIFPSKMEHAESAILPTAKKWIRTCLDDMNCRSPDDHTIILWLNCPVVGIMSSEKYDYFLTCICNLLADWPKNSVCVIVHPNRAASLDKRTLGDQCVFMFLC